MSDVQEWELIFGREIIKIKIHIDKVKVTWNYANTVPGL